jgi:aconitate hydratase
VFLKDIWPDSQEVAQTIEEAVQSDMFRKSYGEVFDGDERWNSLDVPEGERFAWDEESTYVRRPPFFEDLPREPEPIEDIRGARVLAVLGDSVTTDHISPAGSIKRDSPAGTYLIEHDVGPRDFNSYGSRRGNHEVMMRGTFANIRLRNQLAPGTEGGVTLYLGGDGDGEQMTIYDAAMRYQEQGTPLVVLAGKEYGSGSSRDWAAKGTLLLGVKAVIAQSFERIHRSNLVGMGVLPLQFQDGDSTQSLGLSGHETFTIEGLAERDELPRELTVLAGDTRFTVTVRIDTPQEQRYYRHGGILQYVLRQLLHD